MNEPGDRFDEMARAAGRALRHPAPSDGVERVRHARRRQVAIRTAAAGTAVCAFAVGAWAAVRDDSGGGAVSPATTDSVTTTVAQTSTTAAPSTTTSTSSTTTAPTTTTVFDPLVPGDVGAWTTVDPRTIAAYWTNPCCEDTYREVASPEFPAPGGALADGEYHATFEWPMPGATTLSLTVSRYDVGLVADERFAIELPLDDSLQVVFTSSASWLATGADFAQLVSSFTSAVEAVITPRIAGGESFQQIGLDLADHPIGGFSNPSGVVWFTADGLPPVSLGHYDWDPDGISRCITGVSLVVRDGAYTLLVSSQSGG
ncbi:MAG: hypothetical protein M9961_01955 [Ilumatobacteraceae bacterium]|nr:hypothetical protein [Ilumatobacteraceae bacterium]